MPSAEAALGEMADQEPHKADTEQKSDNAMSYLSLFLATRRAGFEGWVIRLRVVGHRWITRRNRVREVLSSNAAWILYGSFGIGRQIRNR